MWSRGPNGEGSPRWGRGASQQVTEKQAHRRSVQKTGTCGPQTRARTHGGAVAAAATAGKKPDFHVRVTERSQKTR